MVIVLAQQAEASRTRWKKAYIDLPLLANPKIIELQESDLEDSRKRAALFDIDSSGSESLVLHSCFQYCWMQLKGAPRHVYPSGKNVICEEIARDLRADLRELKHAFETLCSDKDKEVAEAAQKLQLNIEELQVATRKKDDEIGRLTAEVVDAKDKLRAIEKDNSALIKIKEVEGAQANEAANKLQKYIEELQVAAKDKDDEIRKLGAEALATKNKLLVAEDKIRTIKDGQLESLKRKQASLSNESDCRQKRRMDTNEMHVEEHRMETKMHVEQRTVEIFVESFGKSAISLKVKSSDTIYTVKAKLQQWAGLHPCEQDLIWCDQHLKDCCTLDHYDMKNKCHYLRLVPLRNYVKVYETQGRAFILMVESSDTIADVKAKIQVKEGIPPSMQDLWFRRSVQGALKRLENSHTLAYYKITRGSSLDLHVCPRRKRTGASPCD